MRGFWYDKAFFLSKLHKNVYLDITGLPPSRLLRYFPELEKISSKVVFGSDWPAIVDIKKNIDARLNILGQNAIRLLALK